MDSTANSNISPVIGRLYTSHFLSTWNSRTFEFGAVLVLATIFPGTLLYASIYALLRALSATVFSARVGRYIDATNRLVSIRHSILWQRGSVVVSCFLLFMLLHFPDSRIVFWTCFPVSIFLACCEKLASIGNTVAVERDWVVVLCDAAPDIERGDLNAMLRRIDLFCKLVAPVFVSFIDAYDTSTAIGVVMGLSSLSTVAEYFAIAQVYSAVPVLGTKSTPESPSSPSEEECLEMDEGESPTSPTSKSQTINSSIQRWLQPWISYIHSPSFLASFSLSMLYLTVLSTGPQWQTYLLAIGYTSVSVSLMRVAAVISELAATCFAPMLMDRIGPIRSGLWSVNWQVLCLTAGVAAFVFFNGGNLVLSGAGLTAGIVASRLGLWGFDLSVQFIVQESTAAAQRNTFSSTEIALQNAFELLSFLSTIVFPRPAQFRYPVFISYSAIMVGAGCFAGFVRRERGHLVHVGDCVNFAKGRERVIYRVLGDDEDEGRREEGRIVT